MLILYFQLELMKLKTRVPVRSATKPISEAKSPTSTIHFCDSLRSESLLVREYFTNEAAMVSFALMMNLGLRNQLNNIMYRLLH